MLCDDLNIIPYKIDKTIVIDVDDKVTAKKLKYNKENLIRYELDSRNDKIGEYTNVATAILNKYSNNEDVKKMYEDYVSYLRILQGKLMPHVLETIYCKSI